MNRYAFERNNPYGYDDKNGHTTEAFANLLGAGGTVLAAVVSMVLPAVTVVAVVYLGYKTIQLGTELRNRYPPEQVGEKLAAKVESGYDYTYEYAYAGPRDALRKIIEDTIEDIKKQAEDIKKRVKYILDGLDSLDKVNPRDNNPDEPTRLGSGTKNKDGDKKNKDKPVVGGSGGGMPWFQCSQVCNSACDIHGRCTTKCKTYCS